MNGQIKQAFDFGSISPIKYFFSVAFLLGVLFAFISQSDSPGRWFGFTFIQWQLQTGLPIALLIVSHMLLNHFTGFDRLNSWLQLFVSGLMGVLIFTPLALLLDYFFGQNQFSQEQWYEQLLDELGGVGPPVIISWVAMNAPWILGYRINQLELKGDDTERNSLGVSEINQSIDEGSINEPLFFKLLPVAIGTEITFLKAELHYLEVNTTKGQALILYNLKDAIEELFSQSGIQCHRSYWVNLKHIQSFKKQGRQGKLVLRQDHEIPVSRTKLSQVMKTLQSPTKFE